MVVPMNIFVYTGAAIAPMIKPNTTILMAASLFPLAKPVQEMVMPEVGRTPIRKSPTAHRANFSSAPVKKIFPIIRTRAGTDP